MKVEGAEESQVDGKMVGQEKEMDLVVATVGRGGLAVQVAWISTRSHSQFLPTSVASSSAAVVKPSSRLTTKPEHTANSIADPHPTLMKSFSSSRAQLSRLIAPSE